MKAVFETVAISTLILCVLSGVAMASFAPFPGCVGTLACTPGNCPAAQGGRGACTGATAGTSCQGSFWFGGNACNTMTLTNNHVCDN